MRKYKNTYKRLADSNLVIAKAILLSLIFFTISLQQLYAQEEKRMGFTANIAFRSFGGFEVGLEFDIADKLAFRSTYIQKIIPINNYNKYSDIFYNQLIFYNKENKKGLNHGPFIQYKDESYNTINALSYIDYIGYGLGYAVGYRFKLGNVTSIIPNFSLGINYLDYSIVDGIGQEPSIIDDKHWELEPRLQLYFLFSI